MRYMGGKAKIAGHIASFIINDLGKDKVFYEPFVGGFNIVPALRKAGFQGKAFCSDLHPALIALYTSIQEGWVPPQIISEEEYQQVRVLPDTDPLKAFVGFGCSFGAKYFGGYARNPAHKEQQYALQAHRSILKKFSWVGNTAFECKAFNSLDVANSVIYCDPPYENTTGFSLGKFDHKSFWNKVRELRLRNNIIYVSEHSAPEDFVCIWEKQLKRDLRTKDGQQTRTDRLFTPRGQ